MLFRQPFLSSLPLLSQNFSFHYLLSLLRFRCNGFDQKLSSRLVRLPNHNCEMFNINFSKVWCVC
jgi:hypothetical protein